MKKLIIGLGVQRAATTFVQRCLVNHPLIARPEKKEIDYFRDLGNYGKGWSWYQNTLGEGLCGLDITPEYIIDKDALRRISQVSNQRNIEVFTFLILRNPFDRLFSGLTKIKRDFRNGYTDDEFLRYDIDGIVKRSLYFEQVSDVMQFLPNTIILPFNQFEDDPKRQLALIMNAAGIEASALEISTGRQNSSYKRDVFSRSVEKVAINVRKLPYGEAVKNYLLSTECGRIIQKLVIADFDKNQITNFFRSRTSLTKLILTDLTKVHGLTGYDFFAEWLVEGEKLLRE